MMKPFGDDVLLKAILDAQYCKPNAVRRRMFIGCRNVRISASSADRDRNRSATIQIMSLTRSLIP